MEHKAAIYMDWGLFFEIEISAALIRPLLPPGITPVETNNGNAILTLNLLHFLSGGDQVDLPANNEIDFGVAVPVDNSGYQNKGKPHAKSAVHMLNIASDSEDYLTICRDSGYCTHEGANLKFEFSPDGMNGCVLDGNGPIVTITALSMTTKNLTENITENITKATPEYSPFQRFGQDVIHDHRGEYRLNFIFEGEGLSEPQTDLFELTLEDHPFFRGLNNLAGKQACLSQFALRPKKTATLYLFAPDEA
ncbi:MAG: hypothetical protein V7776_23355 [Halopseudomonas aestusnigri]